MDEAVIPLRAHHGLCLRFFQGKGYSGAFVENMARKKAMLEEKTALSKEAVQTIDETIQAQQEQMERLKKQLQKQHPSKKQKQKRILFNDHR